MTEARKFEILGKCKTEEEFRAVNDFILYGEALERYEQVWESEFEVFGKELGFLADTAYETFLKCLELGLIEKKDEF